MKRKRKIFPTREAYRAWLESREALERALPGARGSDRRRVGGEGEIVHPEDSASLDALVDAYRARSRPSAPARGRGHRGTLRPTGTMSRGMRADRRREP